MEDGTYLKSNTGAWLPVVQSGGYYVARRPLDSMDDKLQADEYLGVWTDTATGTLYLDATEHVDTLERALYLGDLRGELAVWDIAAGSEVLTRHGMRDRLNRGAA